MFQIQSEPLHIGATVLGTIGGFPITNTMTTAIFDLLIFILLIIAAQRFSVKAPSTFQLIVEGFLELVTNFIQQICGNRKIAWRVMPIVTILILFILVSNISTLLFPLLSGFTFNGQALFRSHTNDFNTTLSLAVAMVLLTQFYSIHKVNIFNYISRFIQIPQIIKGFRSGVGNGITSLISAFVGLLDLISEVAKVISLSLRLFENMFAGELLLGIFMTFFAILLPLPIMGLSLLSGIVQAIVFGALVASYFSGVLSEEN